MGEPSNLKFIKMQGLGNDFILIDSRSAQLGGIDLPKLAMRACDRNFGIGADGLIIVYPSQKAHYRMQIINPDGSEPEMCGNGIRCFARYVYETDKLKEEVISVETGAGIIIPAVIPGDDGSISTIEVDMGIPKDEGSVELQGISFKKISMGNPHAVAFLNDDDFEAIDLADIGPRIERDAHFKDRTNVEFARVVSDSRIEVKVWERGAGATLACGTGACAVAAAASILGLTGRKVTVYLPGGELDIEWNDDGHLLMRGPAEYVFEGNYFI
ncbi:MAG TPA: diaminopimelate epimerase [Candidatus Omnitrophota bacterium]|nr:diaminopimelate epimerase [Candidatus Omnitrophota bacterium]